jgi:hypothetical protein
MKNQKTKSKVSKKPSHKNVRHLTKRKVVKKKILKTPKQVHKKITKPCGFVPRLSSRGLSRFGEGREKSTATNSGLKTGDFSRALTIRKKRKVIITEEKIKNLLDFKHIEELFFLVHLLNHSQVEIFLKHYRMSKPRKKIDKKLDSIVRKAATKDNLVSALKTKLVYSLDAEYSRINKEIARAEKSGHDLYVEKLKIESIPNKIRLFNNTANNSDYYKVKRVLFEIENELKKLETEYKKEDKEMEKIDEEIKQLKLKIKEIQNV